MNRTFVSVCLSYLAAVAVPAVLLLGLGIWAQSPDTLSVCVRSWLVSSTFAVLVIAFWFWGPPKPTTRLEWVGRWFIVFIMSAGVGFVCTAWPPLLVSVLNDTKLTFDQNFLIVQNTVWGFICGFVAGAVLEYRERHAPVVEEKKTYTRISRRT